MPAAHAGAQRSTGGPWWLLRSYRAGLRVAVGAAALASASAAQAAPTTPIAVAVSVPPQAYFVERIGGTRVTTEVMIPAAQPPETYVPSPKQMVALSTARLYVAVGHPDFLFERRYVDPFLQRHPDITVVNMAEGMRFLGTTAPAAKAEDAEASGTGGTDPHVWLAPSTVAIAAENIARALIEHDPAHREEYEANFQRFRSDIDRLDADMRHLFAEAGHVRFMVYHPAWGYLARQYGLEQVAIEAGGKDPGPARLVALIDQARRERIRVIFVQSGFSKKNAQVIAAEIGGVVAECDPLAHDWLANMYAVAAAFKDALRHE